MSEPAPPDPGSATALLGELWSLRQHADRGHAYYRAWQIVVAGMVLPEFPLLLDYALEQGLVRRCVAPSAEQPGSTWINPLDRTRMIYIPPGPFLVGTDAIRTESFGFSLARFPVTNAQFHVFLRASGHVPADREGFLAHWTNDAPPAGIGEHPVTWVSYIDAMAYCAWASLTLPTEWLWEKAARGSDGRPFPWGTSLPISRSYNWRTRRHEIHSAGLANVATGGTVPVGSYPRTRSPYGCEDLIGNVSEWCQPADEHDPGRFPPPDAPMPEPEALVPVRGSCFLRITTDRMPSVHRRRLRALRRNRWVGFRPALLLPCCPAQ